jgi:hypothetical protein
MFIDHVRPLAKPRRGEMCRGNRSEYMRLVRKSNVAFDESMCSTLKSSLGAHSTPTGFGRPSGSCSINILPLRGSRGLSVGVISRSTLCCIWQKTDPSIRRFTKWLMRGSS